MLPSSLIGIALAWILANYLSDAVVRLAVGTVGISFAISHWIGLKTKTQNSASGIFWGSSRALLARSRMPEGHHSLSTRYRKISPK